MKTRTYEFQTELPDGEQCFVVADVSGSDWAGDMLNPPEYREIEIMVMVAGDSDVPVVDVSDRQTEEFLDTLRVKALEIEDNQIQAEREAYDDMVTERRHEPRERATERDTNNPMEDA
jgi:hypothetical protein